MRAVLVFVIIALVAASPIPGNLGIDHLVSKKKSCGVIFFFV